MAKKSAFEKFSENLIDSEPLQLRRNAELATGEDDSEPKGKADAAETKQTKSPVAEKPSVSTKPEREAEPLSEDTTPTEGKEELVQLTIQVPKSYKRKLGEMKFKLETSFRDLVVEAIDDLVVKYGKQLNG